VSAVTFFDMDGTLVRSNTARLYLSWRRDRGETELVDMLRFGLWITQYKLGTVDPAEIGARALAQFRGVEEVVFREEMNEFFRERVLPDVMDDARREVELRRERGEQLVILTASTPYVADPLAAELNIEHVISSRLSVADGCFTGDTDALCYGSEKVRLATEWAASAGVDLERSAFYTDSVSDLPMLERVAEPRVVNPDPRLRWHARARGWELSKWR